MKSRPSAPLPLLVAAGLLVGAAAAVAWQPGCPLRSLTGLKCPGCGSGRALGALVGGNVIQAIYWNAMLGPLVVGLVVAGWQKPWRLRRWMLWGAAVLGFGILRNLPFYLLY